MAPSSGDVGELMCAGETAGGDATATAPPPLTHGHAAGGIIYYMEKTIGFHVAGNGTPTMCAIS